MTPRRLNCFWLQSVLTFSVVSGLVFIFLLVGQTISTSPAGPTRLPTPLLPRNGRKTLENQNEYSLPHIRINWDLEALRLWRWRNRYRTGFYNTGELFQSQPQVNRPLAKSEPKDHRQKQRERKKEGRHRKNKVKKIDPNFPRVEGEESCCPVVKEVVSPESGRNSRGHLVELYQDDRIQQKLYEVSCRSDIINQPCRFFENTKHYKSSICKQEHTLTYALVRPLKNNSDQGQPVYHWSTELPVNYTSTLEPLVPEKQSHGYIENIQALLMSNGEVIHQPWYLDYITIRSGCSCQIVKKMRRRKKNVKYWPD